MTDFDDQLQEARARGVTTPCYDSWAWISDDPKLRATAADACLDCPLMFACHRQALERDEPCGVWGGVDFTDRRKSVDGLTKAQKCAIEMYRRKGRSQQFIADTLGITRAAVRVHQERAGITARRRHITADERQQMLNLRDSGLTHAQIATQLDVPLSRVNWACSPGRTNRARKHLPHGDAVVNLRDKHHLTFQAIAQRLGITPRQASHAYQVHLREQEKEAA